MAQDNKPDANGEGQKISSAPSISLPKGGGAIRGIGEKFAANPVTGTGSMSVPVASSPGRSGFGPQLSLSYDSGAGNGPFGFGWTLSLPQITRKTDTGLPQYHDAEESDVFILSGAEDLVPVLVKQNGKWVPETLPDRAIGTDTYTVHRYRPRIEGLFARIERWTSKDGQDTFWRSISRDNITTYYGKTDESRIADPSDPTRVFSWLICASYDDKGNAIIYEYKAEDSDGVDRSQVHERNRTNVSRSANRYLKRIKYGNRSPNREAAWNATDPALLTNWMFEVVFDYGEGHYTDLPLDPARPEAEQHRFVLAQTGAASLWHARQDPFSSYRAGFEVRTYRLCQRVLMFHHFAGEPGVGLDCLVRSTDFTYSRPQDPANASNPVYTFLLSVTQSGYRRNNGGYQKSSLPPVEYEYTQPIVQDTVEDVDPASLENLPIGVDGASYQWTDLHGEGIPGILTEQAGAWFYKRNISPISERPVEFAPLERVATKPNLALAGGQAQFMDLAGDGQPDLVLLDGPMPGLYEHDEEEGWQPFRPFTSRLNRDMRDPNLKFIDLDGDGHADVLISEDDAFVWHASLAEEGFGPVRRVHQALDEEKGPRLVFADGTQSIYLADLSGDGLTDLVRIRNGEVCYWPNLGYGRFGAKVTMDHAPHFDNPDQFDHKRIRLADIDGTGTTDIIYLHRDGARLYFNQSGNSWSASQPLRVFPCVDDLVSIIPTDLLGNGTACLVWSSPLPGDARRPMRYVDLMGGQKPHLLIKTINNLGAETRVAYAPSTKFYLRDKYEGKPWITRLPFPVHVVERVETYDRVSRNRFVTRYAYHHGYFDGEEREFRGFGMVEQWDTEELATLTGDDALPAATNLDTASHVPPVNTKTWFHTGVYLGRDHVSDFYAGLLAIGGKGEYYREPGLTNAQARAMLLSDTELPTGLTLEEEREACRALKGAMLRQEVYALDGTEKGKHPYTVTEQNFTIRRLQPQAGNNHAIFFTHVRESISYHYERNPADPRISHALTLDVDEFGNVLKSVAIGYSRRPGLIPLQGDDKKKQEQALITYAENEVTNPIDNVAVYPNDYRTPLPCEARTYEVTGFAVAGGAVRFSFKEFDDNNFQALLALPEIEYEQPTDYAKKQKRLIEHVRTLYRKDNLSGLLGKCALEPMALPGESYKLAFTPGLLDQVYVRSGQKLLPANFADVLEGGGADHGGYVDLDGDDYWWIPIGRVFLSLNSNDTAAQELAHARSHFFLPHRYRDPFHTIAVSTEGLVTYDAYDLLMLETRDPLGNRVTVGERKPNGTIDPTKPGNDYRVLQPRLVTDPNRNRTQVSFDTLGMVVGTAVMGKPDENLGDSLADFEADLTQAQVDGFYDVADPHLSAPSMLKGATTRIIYDLDRFSRSRQAHPEDSTQWLPVYAATLARETHISDPLPPQGLKIQISFSYSDGFGREIQKKIQAEPGPLIEGGPVVNPRWVGSGWTIFNNKGKPVRQYEPFFSQLPEKRHRFEFGVQVGVSPILFYDPLDRVVATLHPNHTCEKVVFDPWRQTTWDVNDTVKLDPSSDGDLKGFFIRPDGTLRIPKTKYLPTWHELRTDFLHALEFAARFPDATDRSNETSAATRAAAHANTPTTAHFDTLGRPFLTVAHNKVACPGHALDGTEDKFSTRVELDIEGNQREVIDAKDRIVMRYAYDMLGNRIHQLSMEAGARWMLNDVAGKPIRVWDSRGHNFVTGYDALRRPVEQYVRGTTSDSDSRTLNRDILADKIEYGESLANVETLNLRTRIYRHSDSAGVATNSALHPITNRTEAYDFKGNLLRSTREVAPGYKDIINWATAHPAGEPFSSSTTYDALNRPVTLTAPDNSVIRPGYNEANLLERVEANLRGAATATTFVNDIDYNAKGQRELIEYGNGAITVYEYDRLTFRLTQLKTTRPVAGYPGDCPDPPSAGWPGCQVQNLYYTYDPAGNITHIHDDAQQRIFFDKKRVEPSNDYAYDAIYRLIEATGREHLGQGGAPILHSHDDALRSRLPHPNDGNAMGTYTERYVYDAVGNFLEMQHRGGNPVQGWTRRFAYAETSLIEDGTSGALLKTSNRLSSITVNPNGNNPVVEPYRHDVHGNMVRMPHLGGALPGPNMHWDYKDQPRQTDLGGGGKAYYIYDAAGQRVRKVWEKAPGLTEERIYLGGFEIFRRHGGVIGANTATLERETLHIMDDKQRIAMVETRALDTAGNDPAPQQLIRYQFGNHLGSASLELDDQAQIVSYEEYTPYGSTSYQAVRSQTETPKRYRYTGKERDEESGFYYHGARYYAPWLGRWTSCDPAGMVDGHDLYQYVKGNPLRFTDSMGMQANDPPRDDPNRPPDFPRDTRPTAVGQAKIVQWRYFNVRASAADFAPGPGGRQFLGRDTSGHRYEFGLTGQLGREEGFNLEYGYWLFSADPSGPLARLETQHVGTIFLNWRSVGVNLHSNDVLAPSFLNPVYGWKKNTDQAKTGASSVFVKLDRELPSGWRFTRVGVVGAIGTAIPNRSRTTKENNRETYDTDPDLSVSDLYLSAQFQHRVGHQLELFGGINYAPFQDIVQGQWIHNDFMKLKGGEPSPVFPNRGQQEPFLGLIFRYHFSTKKK